MTTRQKLAIFALSFLSIAVPVQAMPGQEENTVQKPETNLSERNARLEQQHAEAISAGLRPTLTLIDLDEECGSACCEYNDCGHYEFMDGMRKTIAEKNKIIDELEAKILVLEAKNQPWSTGKKAAVLAAVVGSYVAAPYAQEYVLKPVLEKAVVGYLAWYQKNYL